ARATALREATSSNVGQESSSSDTSTPSKKSNTTKNVASNDNNSAPSAATPSSGGYSAMISAANAQLGKPYSLGATGPSAFDCSGFTSYAFRAAGVSLPRTSGGQYAAASKISASQAKPGDLVFFNYGSGIAHVGIYVGGGQMINAQNNGVKYDNITSGYWAKYLVGYGRVANF
ncbi:peptidase P60, partial [Listeria monocytogenes]|nr:peptidase P60 [Listeria monocytogenes]